MALVSKILRPKKSLQRTKVSISRESIDENGCLNKASDDSIEYFSNIKERYNKNKQL